MSDAFASAVLAIDEGRVADLHALLRADPALVHARNAEPHEHYFGGSTLLHYVAWNPGPRYRAYGIEHNDVSMHDRMPEVATALLQAGADPNAPNAKGNTVLDLLFTSQLASVSRQTHAIANVLVGAGAEVQIRAGQVWRALANHAPAAARYLLSRGVPWDVRAAAGLGELDRLRHHVGADAPSPQDLGLAALHAYVLEQRHTFDWLLKQPLDLNVTGVGNGTLLHRACASQRLDDIRRLLERGADLNDRHNPFRATPLDWADHAGHRDTVEWLLKHARDQLDVFQAAAYDLPDRIHAIVADTPQAVAETRDIWRLKAVQPLRIAALRRNQAAANALIACGADAQHRGADGRTARDQALTMGDSSLVACLDVP